MKPHSLFLLAALPCLQGLSADQIPVTRIRYQENGKEVESSASDAQVISGAATLLAVEIRDKVYDNLRGASANSISSSDYVYAAPDGEDPGSAQASVNDTRIDSVAVNVKRADFLIIPQSLDEYLIISDWGKAEQIEYQFIAGEAGEEPQPIGEKIFARGQEWDKGRVVRVNAQGSSNQKNVPISFVAFPIRGLGISEEELPNIRGLRSIRNADDPSWLGIAAPGLPALSWSSTWPEALTINSTLSSMDPGTIKLFADETASQSLSFPRAIQLNSLSLERSGFSSPGQLRLEILPGEADPSEAKAVFEQEFPIATLPDAQSRMLLRFSKPIVLKPGTWLIRLSYSGGTLSLRTAGADQFPHGALLEYRQDDLLFGIEAAPVSP